MRLSTRSAEPDAQSHPVRLLKILVTALLLTAVGPSPQIFPQVLSLEQTLISEGLQLLRQGQAAQAKERFDAALKTAPRSADALTWRGVCENQMAEYSAAAIDFRDALRSNPAMLPAHYNLALSLIRLHEIDGAIEQLRIVIAGQPQALQPRYNLALLLEGKGSFRDANRELEAAHALDPTDKGVTLHLLIDLLKIKENSRAASLVSEIANSSTPSDIQRSAGMALVEAGDFVAAISVLEAAHKKDSQVHGTDSSLARAYIGADQNANAIALLQAVPAEQKREEDIYLLALAYTGIGDSRQAAAAFGAAAKLDPNDARPWYHLGLLAAASTNEQAKSVDLLRAAVRLDPSNVPYSLALARVMLISDQAEQAKTVLSRLSVTREDAAQVHALTGIAFAATHGVDLAIPQLQKAIEEEPTMALAHNVLGFCMFQQGKYAEAAAAYGSASKLEPRRLLFARDAALAYERANQPQQALLFAEQANSLGDADAGDHALLGKLYAAAGRRQDAVRELRRAVDLNPDLDSALYLLARTYMQMGDQQQAREWSEKLSAVKQRHKVAFTLQKKAPAGAIRSSTLLQGGLLTTDDAGAP